MQNIDLEDIIEKKISPPYLPKTFEYNYNI